MRNYNIAGAALLMLAFICLSIAAFLPPKPAIFAGTVAAIGALFFAVILGTMIGKA